MSVQTAKVETLPVFEAGPLARASNIAPDFASPGDNYAAILSRNEAVKDAKRLKTFLELRDKYFLRKVLFEDPLFPANNTSLFKTCRAPPNIVWKRPGELCENPQFIIGGADRTDICQGDLGDCWLLAAIACLTLNEKLLYRVIPPDQSFTENYAGIFHFQFWQYGEWVDVVVDDRIPTINNKPIYTTSGKKNEFWSALLEKAYAKLHGSYEALKGGNTLEAMEDFTGGVTEYFLVKETQKELFQIMRKALQRGSLMCCGIEDLVPQHRAVRTPEGLVKGHAYSITGVEQGGQGGVQVRLMRLRDPWGVSPLPTCRANNWASLASSEQEKKRLKPVEDLGEFWMSYEHFQRIFTRVEICNLTPDTLQVDRMVNWTVTVHEGRWVQGCSAGGCRNFPDTFWTNPQYRIQLTEVDDEPHSGEKACTVVIALMQKERRKEQFMGPAFHAIGFFVYEFQGSSTPLPKAFFEGTGSVARSKSYVNLREVTERLQLKPGEYVIVPSTFDPNLEADFILRIFTEKKSTSEVIEESVQAEQAGNKEKKKLKLGQPLEESEEDKHFRQFYQQIAAKDMEICAHDLNIVLNTVVAKYINPKAAVFGLESCRSMIALMDTDGSGKINLEEIKHLWKKIKQWQMIFTRYDVDKSGTMKSFEMRSAVQDAGFRLNNELYNIIAMRYADRNLEMDFDSYISCLVRLEGMFRAFQAFDRDQDGIIKLNVVEWLQLTMYA
ncbi:hypothetical protein ACEWY4_022496 [Coilia grayii]|uniref:Calpain-3 n=1 Tax=Coilia grayii TaxID=363190 RepID=A0ABD1J672_9TELE